MSFQGHVETQGDREDGHVKAEAEVEGMGQQASSGSLHCEETAEAGKQKGFFPSEDSLEEVQLVDTLFLKFWPPEQ